MTNPVGPCHPPKVPLPRVVRPNLRIAMPDATTDDFAAHGIPRPPMQRTRIYIDVANTLTTPGTTGLQRVTRSLIAACQAIEHSPVAAQPHQLTLILGCGFSPWCYR